MYGRIWGGFLSLAGLLATTAVALARTFIDYMVSAMPFAWREGWTDNALSYSGPTMTNVPPALFQRSRHEAGTFRRSAARNV